MAHPLRFMVEMFGAAILMLGVLWAVVTVEGLLKVLERTPPERSGAANASRPSPAPART